MAIIQKTVFVVGGKEFATYAEAVRYAQLSKRVELMVGAFEGQDEDGNDIVLPKGRTAGGAVFPVSSWALADFVVKHYDMITNVMSAPISVEGDETGNG